MKKLIVAPLLILLLLGGCSEKPTAEDYEEARHWCDERGGITYFQFSDIYGLVVTCQNGTTLQRFLPPK